MFRKSIKMYIFELFCKDQEQLSEIVKSYLLM